MLLGGCFFTAIRQGYCHFEEKRFRYQLFFCMREKSDRTTLLNFMIEANL